MSTDVEEFSPARRAGMTTHLPPLPSRPLPPLPEITVFLDEHRETVFAFAAGEDALAATMHRE
jgi:hypothetical protein